MTVYGGGTPPRQHFGVPEMRAFAEAHDDERVKLMMRRIEELLSKSAKWCDAVNKLEMENARLREATRWRSVEEELPAKEGYYITYRPDYEDKIVALWYFLGCCHWEGYVRPRPPKKYRYVTHWQPLPEPPPIPAR